MSAKLCGHKWIDRVAQKRSCFLDLGHIGEHVSVLPSLVVKCKSSNRSTESKKPTQTGLDKYGAEARAKIAAAERERDEGKLEPWQVESWKKEEAIWTEENNRLRAENARLTDEHRQLSALYQETRTKLAAEQREKRLRGMLSGLLKHHDACWPRELGVECVVAMDARAALAGETEEVK